MKQKIDYAQSLYGIEVDDMVSLVFLVAFGASVVGAICGIGGGVIIKPLLDFMNIASVAEISFLSSCTVLSMSCYSVCRSLVARDSLVRFDTATPLAIGAAVGGVLGKSMFTALQNVSGNSSFVGGCQAICLAVVTLATLIYTLNKDRVRTMHVKNTAVCIAVGLVMGLLSSFLGIGGGPIDLMVLYFFFSMETKEAAQNSLYCILISQFASLITTFVLGSVPQFQSIWLVVMILGGIGGGMAGRKINKKLDSAHVIKLFAVLLAVIIMISCYNAWRFLAV